MPWLADLKLRYDCFRSQFTKQPPPILPGGLILGLQQYKSS